MKELYSNGLALNIAQTIEEMKAEQGDSFSLDRINLAELERRSGVSCGKLRRLKRNGFQDLPAARKAENMPTQSLVVILASLTACFSRASKTLLSYWIGCCRPVFTVVQQL